MSSHSSENRCNPVIRGWSNYYSAVVSKTVFQRLDDRLYRKLAHWARYRHPRKPRRWVVRKYWRFGEGPGWEFATTDGRTRTRHGAVPIVRHGKVKDTASPFKGDWQYWATRRGTSPGISRRVATLLKGQRGRCDHCGLFFTAEARLEIQHRNQQRQDNSYRNLAAVHRHCHDQIHCDRRERFSLGGTHDTSLVP